jgi:hypothetical protein
MQIDNQVISEVGNVLYEVAIAIVVSKTDPLLNSGLELLSLWIKSYISSFVEKHWIIDPVLDEDLYFALNSEEELMRSQGKSELTIQAFLFRGVVIYRWGKCYQSIKYNLTTKKIKEPRP